MRRRYNPHTHATRLPRRESEMARRFRLADEAGIPMGESWWRDGQPVRTCGGCGGQGMHDGAAVGAEGNVGCVECGGKGYV